MFIYVPLSSVTFLCGICFYNMYLYSPAQANVYTLFMQLEKKQQLP